MTQALLEAWMPRDAALSAFLPAILAASVRVKPRSLPQGIVHGESAFASGAHPIGILHSRSCKPHTDPDFPQWSVLWVLAGAEDLILQVADHVPRGGSETTRRPSKAPRETAPLQQGYLALFNAHRTHWLEPSPSKAMLVAATFDFKERPSKQAAEARILQEVAAFVGAQENVKAA